MIAAVIPVAFFVPEHVTMTHRFLVRLEREADEIAVFHNGGPLAAEGWDLHTIASGDPWIDAGGWPFYRMWNEGISMYVDFDAVLVLNNDIEWEPGALRELAERLVKADDDVAIVSPSPNGEPRHCFAIRPPLAPHIDERYQTWYGDTELEQLVKRAGRRMEHFDPGITHPHIQTTTDHIPDVRAMRQQDRELYESRWGAL